MTDWKAGIVYLGGNEEREASIFKELGDLVSKQVREIAQFTGERKRRPQHAKTLAETSHAQFIVSKNLPKDLQVGFLIPESVYLATVRFSNAGALIVNDRVNDLRGLAVKVHVRDSVNHDFLTTNAEIHHAKNAYEAMWTSYFLYRPGLIGKISGIVKLIIKLGTKAGLRIVRTLSTQTKRPIVSLATESFWSRSPYRFGSVVLRFRIRAELSAERIGSSSQNLGEELQQRTMQDDIRWVFEIQRYHDEERTPLEDSTIPWNSPFEEVGHLVIGKETSVLDSELTEKISFNPWNTASDDFEPLGNMNRARKMVYRASQRTRAN